jgi:hypothetical protein
MCLEAFTLNSVKSSWADSRIRWVKSTKALETDSTSIIKVLCGEKYSYPFGSCPSTGSGLVWVYNLGRLGVLDDGDGVSLRNPD